MTRLKTFFFLLLFSLSLFSTGALAQTTCPAFSFGVVLTAGQWQACFNAKQNALGYIPVNQAGDTMLGRLTTATAGANTSGFNIKPGTVPSSPTDGDLWTTSSGLFVRINGVTVGPLAGSGPGTFAATSPITVSFPAGVVTYAFNFSVANSFLATQTMRTILAGTTNTYDIGTSATVSAFRTIYAGTSFVGPVGTFTTSVAIGAGSSITSSGAGGALSALAFTVPGTGVATALAVNVGSAGAFVVNGGVLGTPSSGVATNLTGTASGLTAGNVTTNANLTGPITSVGNATSVAAQTGTGSTFAMSASPTFTGTVTTAAISATTVGGTIFDASAGFRIAAGAASGNYLRGNGTNFVSAAISAADLPLASNASGSPSATAGAVKCDGTTITCSSGVITSIGGVATSVQVGVTTVTSGSTGNILYNNGGVLGERSPATGANFFAGAANTILTSDIVYQAETTSTFNATQVLDFNTFYNTKITLTANITSFSCSNQKAGQSGSIRFIQSGAGSFTIPATMGCNMKFSGGTQPVLTTGSATAVDVLVYSCSATNYCVGSLIKGVL